MHRRAFMNVTAGAAAALAFKPLAFARDQERKNPVPYPDPALEVLDPRFAMRAIQIGNIKGNHPGLPKGLGLIKAIGGHSSRGRQNSSVSRCGGP